MSGVKHTPVETGCDCITATDKLLAEHNATIVATLGLFGAPSRVAIECEKRDPKKRGKPPRLIATYCPFCGEKYAIARARGEQSPIQLEKEVGNG